MDAEGVNVLRDHFILCLKFIEANYEKFFADGYEHATPHYIANKLN